VDNWIAVLVAVIAAVPGVLALRKSRGQRAAEAAATGANRADAAESLSQAAAALIAPLSKRLDGLEEQAMADNKLIKDLYYKLEVRDAYIQHLVGVCRDLTDQLTGACIKPRSQPLTMDEIEARMQGTSDGPKEA
jgi:hypothetical protein